MNNSHQNFPVNKSNPWLLSHQLLKHLDQGVIETLFSLGNGTLGTRGTSGYAQSVLPPENEGTYINGAYISEAINYDESAYGFAQFNNKMLQVNNSKTIEISSNNEVFSVDKIGDISLNLQTASYHESLELSTKTGARIKLFITRIVCQHQADLMINNFVIESINFTGKLQIKSFICANNSLPQKSTDPRVGNLSADHQLTLIDSASTAEFSYQLQHLQNPDSLVIVGTSHCFKQKVNYVSALINEDNCLTETVELELSKKGIEFTKYSIYQTSQNHLLSKYDLSTQQLADELIAQTQQKLSRAVLLGFANNFLKHQKMMATFWQNTDVSIKGNEQHQLAIRLNMLHLTMSAGKDGQRNIAAKGLTGNGYDGHYFWDSEIYITPYFIYTQPDIAKSLLTCRFNGLAKAKARAKEMNHTQGALFPWRTIGGDECSSYFPAGTAQYHINSAIAYAVKQYFKATLDWSFMWQKGAELVIETARLWPSLGHFNPNKNNQFCLDTVTGPDEYTALVNNNYYTNAMAKIHLSFACELIRLLANKDQNEYVALTKKLKLSNEEINLWQKIVKKMYLPHDKKRNITPQDDSFLDKKPWDFAHTAKEKYPLLLNFHPLVIYRHQVLKQADVVLANILQDDQVDLQLKENNLAFYEPITTHDSTLSACTHSIAYSEVGNKQAAFNYFNETVLTDLCNLHNNSQHGVHTAAMAGSWMCIVQGFAGLRIRDNYVSFQPSLPKQWQGLVFRIKLLSCQIEIEILSDKITYQLLSGEQLSLKHFQQKFILTKNKPCQSFDLGNEQLTKNTLMREPIL